MRVPLSWLRELVALPEEVTARELADRLTDAGLKVDKVHDAAAGLHGPLVVATVLAFDEEEHKNGKTIRWCTVDDGAGERGVVCGARNFAVGDKVVLAIPGAELPGGFAIGARKTYGHVSDGMICSTRELGIGDDHAGILVLDPAAPVGADAIDVLGLRDEVLESAVTPDRGYALSMRGIARETATAFGLPFDDPAALDVPPVEADGYPVRIEATDRSSRFVARRVTGVDAAATTPAWMADRLRKAGMRPVMLGVDISNYVMLELGQPLHAYDLARLAGPVVVRLAEPGEQIRTLDGVDRRLDPDDLLIADDSGPIGIAGVMGGESTESSATTRDVLVEAAAFAPTSIARSARRHRLSSEASRRFERGVDPSLPAVAAQRAVQLLVELAGGTADGGGTDTIAASPAPVTVALPLGECTRLGGRDYDEATVRARLTEVGCDVTDVVDGCLQVAPPSWRPDLRQPADLVEEVLRLEGYATIPTLLPSAPAGQGLSARQRLVRRVGQALAGAGYVEAPSYPFLSPDAFDRLALPPDDDRRNATRLANPLSEEEPLLRTTLLPGLLTTLVRNLGRGAQDLGIFEVGQVVRPGPDRLPEPPPLGVDRRPDEVEIAALEAAIPAQPLRVGLAVTGERERSGWWGDGRASTWADAVEAARRVAREAGLELTVSADTHAPWHPGRCAALHVDGVLVGHAGELHPRVVGAYGLPPRTAVMELELTRLELPETPVHPRPVSPYPVAHQDVALVVDASVPAATVEAALRTGAGELLESVRLFDVYTGAQVPDGHRSLAYQLRLRAPDRTLTAEEVAAARDAAVAEAHARTGAVLRA